MGAELVSFEESKEPLVDACRQLFDGLWARFSQRLPPCEDLKRAVSNRQESWVLDHVVFRTLPTGTSSAPILQELFEALGYTKRESYKWPKTLSGRTFWMAPPAAESATCSVALPKVVISELDTTAFSPAVQEVLKTWSCRVPPCPLPVLREWGERLIFGDEDAVERVVSTALQWFLNEQRWQPLPSHIYSSLLEECPYGAWVLAFGNSVAQVGVATYLMNGFATLADFNQLILETLKLPLDTTRGPMILGTPDLGYQESALVPLPTKIAFEEGDTVGPYGSLAFVYRFPLPHHKANGFWSSFYQGFGVEKW